VIWEEWWFWIVGGMAIAILELFLPGYLFVGFALGGVAVGLIILGGIWPSGWMDGSMANHLLVLSILSILIWLALRRFLGIRRGQVKTFDRDINED